ncbi:MAG: citryl-CoA lyase [Actinobacteria bacterium]|nr:MAG: citryl-CoA lyase [Actinomycetota bacterium]
MPLGKQGKPVTHIGQAFPDRVEVRGRDLASELMGEVSFTEYFHVLLTGREPSDEQRFFLDLLLVAIAEHGLMPSNVAARMTLAADPGSLHGAVAAGILGCGPVVLGTSEECARLLEEGQARVAAADDPAAAAEDIARTYHAAGRKVPGFGHPVHRPLDPRLGRSLAGAVTRTWQKPLPMNVALPIAAVMLDLGYSSAEVKTVPILARSAGLLAHLLEEQREPIGFLLAGEAEDAVQYERGDERV